jgi:cell division protein FtsQ
MPVSTPTDRRFHRAHVKPSRTRRRATARRKALRTVVMLTLCAGAAVWLSTVVRRTPVLQIATLSVQGNHQLSTGEVLALASELQGQNILLANLEAQRARLLTSGWVEEATLRRILPSTVEIDIVEREPVGLGRFSGRLYLVDAVGNVLDEHGPAFAGFDLPIIDGLSIGGEREIVVDRTRAGLAARLIAEVAPRAELASRISQIDVHDPYDVVVLLSGDAALIHLGTERFAERLQEYVELAPALRARVPEIDYVDLRFDQRVYVRPVGEGDGRTRSRRLASSAPQGPGIQ